MTQRRNTKKLKYEAIVANLLAKVREAITEFRGVELENEEIAVQHDLAERNTGARWVAESYPHPVHYYCEGFRSLDVCELISRVCLDYLDTDAGYEEVTEVRSRKYIRRRLPKSVEIAYAESCGETVLTWWLRKIIVEKKAVCIRCDVVLDTDEGLQTGICADCWKPEDGII